VIPVIAAVIRREGRYLVGRRPVEKRHGGLWEFPGGKMRDGEDELAAARRELAEELDLHAVCAGAPLFGATDPGSTYHIRFVEIEASGTPTAREHSEVGWFTLDELASMALAPTDAAFVRSLRKET
jgi:8-oxo-dGTP pyrophosphatase MutT (NUDIX family)